MFVTADWDAMIGNEEWGRKVFKIAQSGSQAWSGQIHVWRFEDVNSVGERYPNSDAGQWAVNDTIELLGTFSIDIGILVIILY